MWCCAHDLTTKIGGEGRSWICFKCKWHWIIFISYHHCAVNAKWRQKLKFRCKKDPNCLETVEVESDKAAVLSGVDTPDAKQEKEFVVDELFRQLQFERPVLSCTALENSVQRVFWVWRKFYGLVGYCWLWFDAERRAEITALSLPLFLADSAFCWYQALPTKMSKDLGKHHRLSVFSPWKRILKCCPNLWNVVDVRHCVPEVGSPAATSTHRNSICRTFTLRTIRVCMHIRTRMVLKRNEHFYPLWAD